MKFKQIHPNLKLPTRNSQEAGGYDIYMPEAGELKPSTEGTFFNLGFKAAVPEGYVAIILPRSGKGARSGLSLNNTVGVIDSDYRGEWIACLRLRNQNTNIKWEANVALLQYILVPVHVDDPELVDELDETERGEGGFGSTGN